MFWTNSEGPFYEWHVLNASPRQVRLFELFDWVSQVVQVAYEPAFRLSASTANSICPEDKPGAGSGKQGKHIIVDAEF